MRSLSSCFAVTRIWRRTGAREFADESSEEIEPRSTLARKVNSSRPAGSSAEPAYRILRYVRGNGCIEGSA